MEETERGTWGPTNSPPLAALRLLPLPQLLSQYSGSHTPTPPTPAPTPTPVPAPTPAATPTSGEIAVGARVAVEVDPSLRVRSTPQLAGAILGEQPLGALGTVIGGPITADGYDSWRIDYDNGPDGWSIAGASSVAFLSLATPQSPTAPSPPTGLHVVQPTPTPVPAPTPLPSNSAEIQVGSRVAVAIAPSLRVRSDPQLAATILGEQPQGALGNVVSGPTTADGLEMVAHRLRYLLLTVGRSRASLGLSLLRSNRASEFGSAALVCLILGALRVHAVTYYVDFASGSDLNSGLSPSARGNALLVILLQRWSRQHCSQTG